MKPWIKRISAATLMVLGTILALRASFRFAQHETPFFQQSREANRKRTAMNDLANASRKLKDDGARVDDFKWGAVGSNPFQHVDLANWRGRPSSLETLAEFARLSYTGTASDLFVRLGPSVDDKVIPILARVPNLRVVEVNGASITSDARKRLLAANPKCRFASIKMPWDGHNGEPTHAPKPDLRGS